MSIAATREPAIVGRGPWPLATLADLGGLAILAARAATSPLRPRNDAPPLPRAVIYHAGWMIGMGLPLVALISLSFGSFLAMQAYFGATFTEGTGIVVGLGLIRNVSPLISGFVLAGLIAATVASDLKGGARPGLDDPRSLPDRDVARGDRLDTRPTPSAGRIALARILGATLAGPTLAIASVLVGSTIGLLVARSMLGQSPAIFLAKVAEMLQPIDVIGIVIKGAAFPASAALISTYEGLRPESQGGSSPYRAALRSIVAVLLLNFTWFNMVYLAGDPFGPDVVASAG